MIIRKAEAKDLPAINELFSELDSDAIKNQPEHFQKSERTKEYLMEIIDDYNSDFLLAAFDNEVVGFSLLFEREIRGISLLIPCKYAYIQDFIVKKEYRDQGIGTMLFNSSKVWAKEHGMEYLRLSVFPVNDKGIQFYKRNGMSEQMLTMECTLK